MMKRMRQLWNRERHRRRIRRYNRRVVRERKEEEVRKRSREIWIRIFLKCWIPIRIYLK